MELRWNVSLEIYQDLPMCLLTTNITLFLYRFFTQCQLYYLRYTQWNYFDIALQNIYYSACLVDPQMNYIFNGEYANVII